MKKPLLDAKNLESLETYNETKSKNSKESKLFAGHSGADFESADS